MAAGVTSLVRLRFTPADRAALSVSPTAAPSSPVVVSAASFIGTGAGIPPFGSLRSLVWIHMPLRTRFTLHLSGHPPQLQSPLSKVSYRFSLALSSPDACL